MKKNRIEDIALPTGVKGLKKYVVNGKSGILSNFRTGTPAHVKAAITYNNLLDHFGVGGKYEKISNSEKIKWVYLKQNELGLESCSYKGYEDPPEIMKFIKDFINPSKLYKQALEKKIMMFYEALGWDEPTDATKTMERFF